MLIEEYRDVIVWERSMKLAIEIYRLIRTFGREELYALTSRMHRVIGSNPSTTNHYPLSTIH